MSRKAVAAVTIIASLAVLVVATYLDKFSFTSFGNILQHKEINISQLIESSANELKDALTSDSTENKIILERISRFTKYLTDPSYQNFVLEFSKENNLYDLAYNKMDLLSSKCQEKKILEMIIKLIDLTKEMTVIGQNELFKCHINTSLRLIEECNQENIFNLVINSLKTHLTFPFGQICLQNSGERIFSYISHSEYGPSDIELLIYFAEWADNVRRIRPYDRVAMCDHLNKTFNHKSQWDVKTQQHFCLLSSHVRCPVHKEIGSRKIIESKVCQDFIKMKEEDKKHV